MEDFSTSYSQSNPVFGKCIYSASSRDLAEHGYTTPLIAIESCQIKDNDIVNVSGEEITDILSYFVDDLIIAVKDLDKRIVIDSKGKRRAFMFVTVPGNSFLRALRYSERFNNFINENRVGVYMTSSPINFIDEKGNRDYYGGGYIKKAKNNFFESKQYSISDFLKIINNVSSIDNNLQLTNEEIYNNINILVNIDQCNTGINLPGLNGVYIARSLEANNPLSVQIPGRICRPDKEDLNIIGNKETSAYSENCQYIKPFGYIYIPVGLFTGEEFDNLRESMIIMYNNNSLFKLITLKTNIGLSNKNDEPNNEDKSIEEELFDFRKEPNWSTDFNKIDLLKQSIFGNLTDFKNKITIKIIKSSFKYKVKIKEMMEEFFKDKKITNYTLEEFYNSIKSFPIKY